MILNKLCTRKNIIDSEFDFPAIGCYLIPIVYFLGNLIYLYTRFGKIYITGYYMIHYVYTYKHGFVPRGLVGEVISWFYDTITEEQLANINTFFSVCLALACSLYIGRMFHIVRKDKYRFSVLFLIVLVFFVLAAPINFYYADPKLDKILWTLTFIAILLSSNRFGIWLVPAICIIATMVNPVFIFCSMVLVAIILLQEFHNKNYSLKNGIICGVSYLSMIALLLFGPASQKLLKFSNPNELIDFYFSRYEGTLAEDVYLLFETEWLFDYFDSMPEIIRKAYNIYFLDWGNGLKTALAFLLMAVPVYCLFAIFWIKTIKFEENKFQKFIFFLCAISPVVIIPPVILSWEFSKYLYNNVLMQAGLVIYFLVNKSPALMNTLKEIENYCKTHLFSTFATLSYFVIYIALFSNN